MPTLLFYTIKRKSPKEKGKVRLTDNNRLQPCAVKTITCTTQTWKWLCIMKDYPGYRTSYFIALSCKSLLACTALKPSSVQFKRSVLAKTGLSVLFFFLAGRCPKEFFFKKALYLDWLVSLRQWLFLPECFLDFRKLP